VLQDKKFAVKHGVQESNEHKLSFASGTVFPISAGAMADIPEFRAFQERLHKSQEGTQQGDVAQAQELLQKEKVHPNAFSQPQGRWVPFSESDYNSMSFDDLINGTRSVHATPGLGKRKAQTPKQKSKKPIEFTSGSSDEEVETQKNLPRWTDEEIRYLISLRTDMDKEFKNTAKK
jgi:hypothetical protein